MLYEVITESLGFGIRHNIKEMERAGAVASRIVAIGGASGSRSLMQVISDVTGISQA